MSEHEGHVVNPKTGRRWKTADITAVDVALAAASSQHQRDREVATSTVPSWRNTLGWLQDSGAPRKVCLAALQRWRWLLDLRLDQAWFAFPSEAGWGLLRRSLTAEEYRELGGPPERVPPKPGSLQDIASRELMRTMLAAEEHALMFGDSYYEVTRDANGSVIGSRPLLGIVRERVAGEPNGEVTFLPYIKAVFGPGGPQPMAMTNGAAWDEIGAAIRARSYRLAIARGHIRT